MCCTRLCILPIWCCLGYVCCLGLIFCTFMLRLGFLCLGLLPVIRNLILLCGLMTDIVCHVELLGQREPITVTTAMFVFLVWIITVHGSANVLVGIIYAYFTNFWYQSLCLWSVLFLRLFSYLQEIYRNYDFILILMLLFTFYFIMYVMTTSNNLRKMWENIYFEIKIWHIT